MDKSPIVTRINSLLAQKGITKAEFYEKCELTSASYSQWNTGKTKPRLRTIERIAKFLDVSSEYLLYGNTAPEPPQDAKKAPTKTGERELDMSAKDLTALQKDAVNYVLSLSPEKLSIFLKLGRAAFDEDVKDD